MKIIKLIGILLLSVILQTLLITPRLVVMIIKIVESILKITRQTIQFLIKQIANEVLKPINHEQQNETEQAQNKKR